MPAEQPLATNGEVESLCVVKFLGILLSWHSFLKGTTLVAEVGLEPTGPFGTRL